jgi:hypothetical protein
LQNQLSFLPSLSTPDQIYFPAPFQQINVKQSVATVKFSFFAATLLAVLQPISAGFCKHYAVYCGQYLLVKGKQQAPPHLSLDIADVK